MLRVLGTLCLLLCLAAAADYKAPQVNVYTTKPLESGKKNTLVCYVSNFHPPRIEVDLLRNGVEMPNTNKSDLTFQQDWTYVQMTSTDFTPNGESYTCRVRHNELKTNFHEIDTM